MNKKYYLLILVLFLSVLVGCSGPVDPPPKPYIIVTIEPATAKLITGETKQFTVSVYDDDENQVIWAADRGKISKDGLYTAPDSAGTDTITATSVVDPNKSDTATVTIKEPLAEILIIPDKNNIQYSINSYDSSYSVVDEKSELRGSASIKYDQSSSGSHIWLFTNRDYYSIYIKPIPKIDSINVPFIKKTIWDSGPYFVNNSNGSISFPKASLKADFTGKVSVSGICVAYGDDYKFNSTFNVLKGQLMNISITSITWNRFKNTKVSCSWAVGVDTVNGAHSSLEFR